MTKLLSLLGDAEAVEEARAVLVPGWDGGHDLSVFQDHCAYRGREEKCEFIIIFIHGFI